jgi:hypothetical protein
VRHGRLEVGHGRAGLGLAGHGSARYGWLRFGRVWPGVAGFGSGWLS